MTAQGQSVNADSSVHAEGPSPRGVRSRLLGGGLVVGSVVLLLLTLNFIVSHRVITPDFLSFYCAGAILHRGMSTSLYNIPLQRRIELQAFPHASVFLPFYHPPFEAVLFVPFAHLLCGTRSLYGQ